MNQDIGAKITDTFLYVPSPEIYLDPPANETYFSNCYQPADKTLGYAAENDNWLPHSYTGNVYRKAVCPSDWVAFNVGLSSRGKDIYQTRTESMSTWSTAICCKLGHEVVTDTFRLYGTTSEGERAWACAQTMFQNPGNGGIVTAMPYTTQYRVNETVNPFYDYDEVETTSTIYWRAGRAYYPGWSVEWMAEDNATLDPPWPTLTSDMLIPTWVPGTNVSNHGSYDNKGSGRSRPTTLPKSKFDRVGVPLIASLAGLLGLVLLGGVLLWCMRRKRAKKNPVKTPSEEMELEISD